MPRPTLLPCLLLLSVLAVAPAGAQAPEIAGQAATLNLKAVDINVLIQTVSEITGRSFIVDPRVEGKVTVISGRPLPPDEVWDVFTSVLAVHGYAVVPAGRMWKVVPEAAAAVDGRGAQEDGPDTVVTRVIEVRQLPAAELAALLQPLVPPSGRIAARGRQLVITDRAANVERLVRLAARIDTPTDHEVEVMPLQHADAAEIARALGQLDVAPGADGPRRLVADPRSNSLLVSGDRAERLRLRAMIANLDTPLREGEATQVIYLRNARAEELVPILERMAELQSRADGPKAATISAHGETNALVVSAPPAVFRQMAAVVRQLDVRRAQVMVEAVIAEVSDELADELGVQWQATGVDNNPDGSLQSGVIGGTNFPGRNDGGIVGAMRNPLDGRAGLSLGYLGGTISLPGPDGTTIEILQIGALVQALRGDGRANILSRPSVITLDNQAAEFKVVQEVPFLTGAYSTTGNGSNVATPFQTIERKDVGLILRVTPHVNEGDSVRLDIVQEVSSLLPGQVSGAVDLVTNKREIRTTVQVADGGLIVLGGLSSEEVLESVQAVPGLSRIPLLGNLFKSRKSSRSKRNLMVFLRPVILADDAAASALSSEKYNALRMLQLQARDTGEAAVRGGELPLLPEQTPAASPMAAPSPSPPPAPEPLAPVQDGPVDPVP
jgi:general secretion pathway protein D